MDMIIRNVKREDVSPKDFPFICRICLMPGDLRPFDGEDYLLDLFQSITNINVRSEVDFPRNVCNGCVNKLEDTSLFIDISKYNCTKTKHWTQKGDYTESVESKASHECAITIKKITDEVISLQENQICRFCLLPNSLTSFEENGILNQLFQNITDIDMKGALDSVSGNSICNNCIVKLVDISTFINLSLDNNEKLEHAIGKKESVKSESCSGPIGNDASGCSNFKVENITDNTELMDQSHNEDIFVNEIKEENETIDIKENVLHSDLVVFTMNTYQNPLKLASVDVPETLSTPKLVSEQESFSQSPCKKSFTNNSDQKIHLQGLLLAHTEEQKPRCDFNEKSFSQRDSLRSCVRTHIVEKPIKCEMGKNEKTSSNRQQLGTCTKEKPFECDICGNSFSRKKTLQNHVCSHTEERPLTCYFCEKSFSRKRFLQRHMHIHTKKKSLICNLCERSFTRKETLQRHMLSHTEEKPFECNVCETSFSRKEFLRNHERTHTEEKPFECNICQKRFTQKATLRNHGTTHTEEKPHECEICQKSFTRKGTLRRHMLSHTEEKPFKCNFCDKSFSRKESLQNHLRTHTEEKTFECDFCKKSFSQKATLRNHLRTHTEGKTFECDVCKKKFSQKITLRNHMRTHTEEKPLE